MKPHSLSTITLRRPEPPLDAFTRRHGVYPKGTVLPETQVEHSPRRKVSDFPEGFLNKAMIEKALDHNQQVASCCRASENHEIEARKSHPDEPAPDVYVLHCTCGRQHRFFCVGMEDKRPEWR